jgi:5-methylcytosine-specific restriction endonuclease McrA
MRIIKLSQEDPDMKTREMVDDFFINYLPGEDGERFSIKKGLISKDNFSPGERLVFSYNTEIVYVAYSKSGILNKEPGEPHASTYPYYFLVEPSSIVAAAGRLSVLEAELAKLGIKKRITVQGWPHIVFPKDLEGHEDRIFNSLRQKDDFYIKVKKSLNDNAASRRERLKHANKHPKKVAVTNYVYERNPDVVAEALWRAKGKCEECGRPSPFLRRNDGSPYLEVHHIKPLSEAGEDTITNVLAMCPNCHRKAHFG